MRDKMKTMYVAQLPLEIQTRIKGDLESLGLSEEDVKNGMESRLCDLEETIDIKPYLVSETNL